LLRANLGERLFHLFHLLVDISFVIATLIVRVDRKRFPHVVVRNAPANLGAEDLPSHRTKPPSRLAILRSGIGGSRPCSLRLRHA
jgi:hypothetical protein